MNKQKRILPDGWRWERLGNASLVKLIMGQSPPGDTYNKDGIGLPFFQGKTDFGTLSPEPTVWCSKPLRIAEPSDILLCVRAPVGPTNLAKEKCCVGRGLAAIRCKDGLFSKYLLMVMRHFENKISLGGSGSIFNAIGKDEIKAMGFPVPPTLDEQIQIAEELERRLEKVQKMKEAAIKEKEAVIALQGAILREVFPYREGDKLPDDWRWEKLGDIARLKNGINFNSSEVGSGILTVDVYNMYTANVYPSLETLYRVSTDITVEYLLKEKDILFVRSSVKKEGVGWSTVFQGYTEPVCFCGFLIRGRLIDIQNIMPEYIVYYFRRDSVRKKFIATSGQSTITNINQESLKKILIPIPWKIEKQLAVVDVLRHRLSRTNKMEQMIDKKIEAIEALQGAFLRNVFDFHEVCN